jgi:nucleoside-diphosphate-sugar epimerase
MNLAGKRALVTGADGFIGSHLVEELLTAGCDVRAFVFYNSFNSRGWLDTGRTDSCEYGNEQNKTPAVLLEIGIA